MNGYHETDDRISQRLHEDAPTARVQPSSQLRQRTLAALREATPLPAGPHWRFAHHRRAWTLLAAAAMVGIVVVAALALWPDHDSGIKTVAKHDSPATHPSLPDLTRRLSMPANVRMASLTQPLEREAENLKSAVRRAIERVRNNLPRANDHNPAFAPTPAAPGTQPDGLVNPSG
jgi:hypothetical protein